MAHVLPARPTNAQELSEVDLEKIAGGTAASPLSLVVTTAVASTVVALLRLQPRLSKMDGNA
jgi:L-arabinose isomerase